MAPSDAFRTPHSPVGPVTILLIENQPDLRFLLKRLLGSRGYACLEAANGREAIWVIDQHPSINLIFSDYLMSRMDGLFLLQTHQQLPAQRKIPFILITAYRSASLWNLALCEGAFAILSKPYLPTELFQFLEQGMSYQAA